MTEEQTLLYTVPKTTGSFADGAEADFEKNYYQLLLREAS